MATCQNRQFSFTICFCFCVNDVRSSCRSPSSSRSSTSSPSWGEVVKLMWEPPLSSSTFYLHYKSAAGNSLWDPSACPFSTCCGLGSLTFWGLLTSVRGVEDVLRVPLQVHHHRRHGLVTAAKIGFSSVIFGDQMETCKVVEIFLGRKYWLHTHILTF